MPSSAAGFTTALVVAGTGAIGSVLRWLVAVALPTGRMPWATLAVNVVGSLAIGVCAAALASRGLADSRLRAALIVGLIGGFTTYSSFAFEYVDYVQRRALASAAIYVAVTLVACGLACALGIALGRRL